MGERCVLCVKEQKVCWRDAGVELKAAVIDLSSKLVALKTTQMGFNTTLSSNWSELVLGRSGRETRTEEALRLSRRVGAVGSSRRFALKFADREYSGVD